MTPTFYSYHDDVGKDGGEPLPDGLLQWCSFVLDSLPLLV